jgi:hypothetical protein
VSLCSLLSAGRKLERSRDDIGTLLRVLLSRFQMEWKRSPAIRQGRSGAFESLLRQVVPSPSFGEPNSLEWKTPADGIADELDDKRCVSAKYTITPARIGQLTGAEGRLNCAGRSIRVLLVFRPKGDQIYWLWLETAADKEADDARIFDRLASTFKIIARK